MEDSDMEEVKRNPELTNVDDETENEVTETPGGMEGTNENMTDFPHSGEQTKTEIRAEAKEEPKKEDREGKKESGTEGIPVTILETITRKLEDLNASSHELLSAANNMNESFNRGEKNYADYADKMEDFFDAAEIKMNEKIDLAVDEYIRTFKKVTDIGNQNMKGFFKALVVYQQKLGKPVTSQAKTIYYLSIMNTVLLAVLIALKFVRI